MARQITWAPSDGGPQVTLTDPDSGLRVLAEGTRGLDSPTYRTSVDTYAGVPGGLLQAIQADVRDVSLGMSIEADSETEFRAKKRGLIRAMRPMVGDGQLSFADELGVVKKLTCRYAGGLEGDAADYFDGKAWRAVVKFTALDPWFRGDSITLDVGLGIGTAFFPFFPMALSPSAVQGQFTVDLSDADAPSYPVWTITGPGSALTLTNNTTGRQIVVNAPLAAGARMVIDTQPGQRSVRAGDGSNLMGALGSDPAMWPLVEDINQVTAALTGATGASRIAGRYEPLYAGI